MRDNPPRGVVCRIYQKSAVHRVSDYRYRADFNEIFPDSAIGDFVWLFTSYKSPCNGALTMAVNCFGPMNILVNGVSVFVSDIFCERNPDTPNVVHAKIHEGINDISIRFEKTAAGFGGIFGTHIGKWNYIFLNPLDTTREGVLWGNLNETGGELHPRLYYPSPKPLPSRLPVDEQFWQTGFPDTFWRPYYDEGLFGQWNYPLGVTLRGLMRFAILHASADIALYVRAHLQMCIDTFEYALFDKAHYGGAASIHNLLAGIDSLDDCGSMGATLLEAKRTLSLQGTERISDYVCDYIMNRQARRSDGAFWRKEQMHSFQNETLWADDLYMATSFLREKFIESGERKYLEECFNQFLRYKDYLYIPSQKLFSHVYDFRRGKATQVPWGRGNGWALYSLCDVLAVAPNAPHELFELFESLCEGVLALQSDDGRWRQVLSDSETYLETSCSAMFIYAFLKGIRHSLLPKDGYASAALRAWKSLKENALDCDGNVLGVCTGSEFSFSKSYYASLGTRINDTHGVGIVLAAACEIERYENA